MMADSRTHSEADSIVSNTRQSLSLLQKLGFWTTRKKPPEKVLRSVVSNVSLPTAAESSKHYPHKGYRNNKIRTTKYSPLSFIPKNLFEQFHRFANLYFILIVVLNWVPRINAFGKEIAIIPVVFVLGVTAIKDWFEDIRRYKSDNRVNNNTCRVYSKEAGRYVKSLWKTVRVGDFVHLSCNELIPADLLLLRCSDENGLCYIETANLDGESNLKQREVARCFLNSSGHTFNPSTYQCRIECDPPNHRIYRFNGCVIFPSGERVPISKENLLLRDCIVKNADFVEGIVVYAGHETKAMLNNGGPRYKRSKLEKLMNRDVVYCVFILLLLCFLGALGHGFWLNSFEDRQSVPFLQHSVGSEWYEVPSEAFFVFLTFVIVLQVMIPLSLYVTIEIIKLGQVYFIHEDMHLYDSCSDKRLECRALNIPEELGQIEYIFSDKTGTLTENNMVFRQCTIGGIDYQHERTTPTSSVGGDSSSYDEVKDVFRDDVVIPNESLLEELSNMEIQLRLDSNTAEIVHLSHHNQRIQDFFLLLAVCNTVVVAKYPHKDQMNSSGLCINVSTPTVFRHKSSGECWDSTDEKYAHLLSYTTTPNSSSASTPAKRPENLAIPPGLGVSASSTPLSSPFELKPIYEAESPDETALVNAAFAYNCRLLRRSPDSVVLSLPGEGVIEFKVLHVLPFDATRKRMSVILEHPFTGQKILFCKGADSHVLPLLAPAKTKEMKEIILKTQQHVNKYSRKGLRILCMAKKVIHPSEYESWLVRHKEAECCFEEKEKKLYYSACAIERNLEILGATGIEDRLQSGVPSTIQSLRAANIVIWVLTGDKQETAVNIAYSCKLFSTDMEVITLNARSKETTEDTIRFYLDQIGRDIVSGETCSESTLASTDTGYFSNLPYFRSQGINRVCDHRKKQRALVIDGRTLAFVLDQKLDKMFLSLAHHCTSVLCCRATPLQKASIVKMIKDILNVKTLAIGDGANDVSMIQVADVGVGISGREGMQAVMASDFALARFSYLERLLLVHGHWCYDRLARTVLYFFYKNASFIFVICWYQWFCGFSGAVMIDDIYLMLFNVMFISLPPIVQGILDKDCPEEFLLRYPQLYARGQKSEIHTKYSFWLCMLDAVYQSIVTFFIPFIAYNDSDVNIWEFGTTICTCCVIVQLLYLAIETRSWTYLHAFSIFISIFIYFGFAIIYNTWPDVSVGMYQSPYWVIIRAMESPVFWLCIILVSILSCLPRFVVRALQGSILPSPVTAVLLDHKNFRNISNNLPVSVLWSRESNGSSIDLNSSLRSSSVKTSQVFTINSEVPGDVSVNSLMA